MNAQSTPRVAWSFGPFSIDAEQRLLRRGEHVIPLEPKVADSLIALVAANGRLLSKDEFLQMVWPDTFVEENSLARNISTLRRVLGDLPEGGPYIETVPRRGYRFVASVTVAPAIQLPSPPSLGRPADSANRPAVRHGGLGSRRARHAGAAAVIFVTSAIGFATWRRAVGPSSGSLEPMRQVTTDAAFATMPSLSLNGELVAYASDRAGRGDLDIWIQPSNGGNSLRLTNDPADDDSPSFSPDGRLIAFRSDREPAGIYVVPALGGEPRLVIAGGRQPEFSPDGKWLAYWTGQWRGPASELPTASYVIALAGGAPRRVLNRFVVARDPLWAPDGQSLLVLGKTARTSDDLDWWRVPLDSGEPHATHALDQRGLRAAAASAPAKLELGAWTSVGVIYSHDGNLWSLDISPAGLVRGQPNRLTYGAGSYQEPSVSRNGMVAFAVSEPRRVIERASLISPDEPAVRLYADRRTGFERVTQTRDGSAIVLERLIPPTLREIVVRNTTNSKERVVIRVESTNRVDATVSPDGRRVAYVLTPFGSSTSGEGFVVDTAAGLSRRVCQGCEPYGFLSDSRHLLVVGANATSVQLIDSDSTSMRALVGVRRAGEQIDRPHASPDDRMIAFRVTRGDAQKVYVAPMPKHGTAGPDTWQEIQETTGTGRAMGWSADSSVLYLFLDTDGFRCVWGQRVNRATGRLEGTPFAVRHFHQTQGLGISTGFGNAVAGGSFVYEYSAPAANIWLLRLPPAK